MKANVSQHKSWTRLTASPSSGKESLGNGTAFGVHFIEFHPYHAFLFEPSLQWKWVLMHSLLGGFSLIFHIGCKHSMKFVLSSLIAGAIGMLKCISIADIRSIASRNTYSIRLCGFSNDFRHDCCSQRARCAS